MTACAGISRCFVLSISQHWRSEFSFESVSRRFRGSKRRKAELKYYYSAVYMKSATMKPNVVTDLVVESKVNQTSGFDVRCLYYFLHLYIRPRKCSIRTMLFEVILHSSGYDTNYGGVRMHSVKLKPTVSNNTEHRCNSFQMMLTNKTYATLHFHICIDVLVQ